MSALGKLQARANASSVASERVVEIPLNKIRFDPTQPRKAFHHIDGQVAQKDEDYIAELAESIKHEKLIHAITVQEMGDGTFLVVVGECRTRAHIKLGWPTIRGVIRNDLTDPAQRLLFQLSENVNRQDLTDYELALSIKELMAGTETTRPMKQVEIAAAMGKSEGWVSRFVKFGDENLQRLWYKSGIADTVEKLYRLSTLPMALQVDIQRRVELPEGDPDRLEKPLNRDIIDKLIRSAKAGKAEKNRAVQPDDTPAPMQAAPQSAPAPDAGGEAPVIAPVAGNGVDKDDVIGQAFSQAAEAGRAARPSPAKPMDAAPAQEGYQLPPEARAAILGSVPKAGAGSHDSSEPREAVQPPVNCRVSMASVLALPAAVQANKEVREAIAALWCDVSIPGPLAQLLANELVGVIVDDREVPAVVQTELSKLR